MKKELATIAVDVIVNLAVSAAVGNVVTALMPQDTKLVTKVLTGTGVLILSSMLSQAAREHVKFVIKI